MKIINKSAPSDYTISEKLEAGIALLGSEVKAIRAGHADLTGSYVKIMDSEAYMVNSKVFPYKYAQIAQYDEARTRKLLLHKKEILALKSRLQEGSYVLIPLSFYERNGTIKVQIGLSRGKKKHEKRAQLKARELERQAAEELKRRNY